MRGSDVYLSPHLFLEIKNVWFSAPLNLQGILIQIKPTFSVLHYKINTSKGVHKFKKLNISWSCEKHQINNMRAIYIGPKLRKHLFTCNACGVINY